MCWSLLSERIHPKEDEGEEEDRKVVENHLKLLKVATIINQLMEQPYFETARFNGHEGQGN